ncbi:Sugar transferase involved in LPS biosynthesis (colanic, teichoic acid) [Formivibrio citricus]|uniref:Sugar transferase involved in LPS biosynthesis (Colanic, teichoic acid) n=1 Tax=Formivibrio citricus TaxID=83765 RepID=A0A1I4XX59_9NEIS|nr:sugar transferase [Formivibrio citricus]SFN30471.1 Sugar transferase involved in LPS biosynthesis (colanic, teichoic acid) [Formivibrio citricus]
MFKRSFDFCIALTLLIILLPVIAATAVMVRWKLGSPIFFRQIRPGRHGKLFGIYKFRTMLDSVDADGNVLPDDLRLTRFGVVLRKLSLDELPQLINVLRGDMSLVGPRPLLEEYLPLYSEEQARRHDVRPGITGWAQVSGRNTISWEERFRLDVWYVDHCSFWLDMKILWLTVVRVFQAKDINQPGVATMEKFTGNNK